VCGKANPVGLNLAFVTDGRQVTASFIPRVEHIGFADTIHGGLVSTVLDEAMVRACGVSAGQFAYCAELIVRFRHPVRPENRLQVVGELVEDRRGRLLLARGEIRDPAGRVLASATGKYIPVPPDELGDMLADFEGDIRSLLSPGPAATASAPSGPATRA
jgi:acyl-coenzyme A thioesterase PaaI-like protein